MKYPSTRNRRLRKSEAIRSLVKETTLSPNDFIVPLFLEEGENKKTEISSMPGYFRYSLDKGLEEINDLIKLGIKCLLLFVLVPEDKKDNEGNEAINPDGLMPKSIREIKNQFTEICVMSDVAFDPYSIHGHDGIVKDEKILNDQTLELLQKISILHAEAGVDFVAPSDMMDGRIGAIRSALDENSHQEAGIMAYSAKYASSFYGPFRDALDSAPGFGDKKTYQMDPANSREAIKEAIMDQEEGADILMIKPAMPYLDIIQRVRENTYLPIAAYQVSGEYAMIKAAIKNGYLNEKDAILESVIAIKRAGSDLIASYFSKEVCRLLNS